MANIHQSLLESPKIKFSPFKVFYVLLSIIFLIGSIALVSLGLLNITSTYPHLMTHFGNSPLMGFSCLGVFQIASVGSPEINGVDRLRLLLQKSTASIKETMRMSKEINGRINDQNDKAAIADCLELMEISNDRITGSIMGLDNLTENSYFDIHTWLSSVLTNHVTCLDGLNGPTRPIMEPRLKELIIQAETFLDVVVAISCASSAQLLRPLDGDFPVWVSSRDRKLLTAFPKEISANVVVAKDGSGNYKTVQEAIDSAPNKSEHRYVIHIKKGTYKEIVRIASNKKKLMIVGDGMDSTIITGSLNFIDGTGTFQSATVAAVGDEFMAQDIYFQNTAGPQKHQAVALRVGADKSIINRCRIDAYQDTLYAHSNRQFYRDCHVIGTIDFIFGNAAVVLQNSRIEARKPMTGQFNTLTAQGRTAEAQNTGTSIQNCSLIASKDLEDVKGSVRSYLGRPWKNYSTTVVMQSYIGDYIDPAGWSIWAGDFALDTLFYGEYLNRGPGAGTAKRVKWKGYRVITSADVASKFTVAELIQGGSWLRNSGVAFTEGL